MTVSEHEAVSQTIHGDLIGRDRITVGDVTDSNIAIGAGAQLIIQQALSRITELDREHALAERRLVEAVIKLAGRYRQLKGANTINRDNPYKALLNYELEDAPFFYGRSEAITALWQRLEQARLTVLHSESGAGKSSLLQAGIGARLLAGGQLPIYLRPYNQSPGTALKRAFLPDLTTMPELERLAAASMRGFLRTASEQLDGRLLCVFIDQFEEFFETVPPPEQAKFIHELSDCLNDPGLNVRWVLALRKEYFSSLAHFRPLIANPFANDYYLERFTTAEAKEVIITPANKQDVAYEPGLVETILNDLQDKEGRLDPPQLQLVCHTLFIERVKTKDPSVISCALYEKERGGASGARGILSNHLKGVLATMPAPKRKIARYILGELVTSQGRRVAKTESSMLAKVQTVQAGTEPQFVKQVLKALTDDRLLRMSDGDNGDGRYELVHDYLLDQIELDPETKARKLSQEILDQEVTAWLSNSDFRIPLDKLLLIESYLPALTVDEEAKQLLRRSRAAVAEIENSKETARRRELALERQARLRAQTIAFILGLLVLAGGAYFGRNEYLRQRAKADVNVQPVDLGSYILAFEIVETSNARWRRCVQAGRCQAPPRTLSTYFDDDADLLPVTGIDATQAAAFCHWIGRRLPTLAQWQFVAIDAPDAPWPKDKAAPRQEIANLWDGNTEEPPSRPQRVGSRALDAPPGIYDLIGNVAEWVATAANKETTPWPGNPRNVPEHLFRVGGYYGVTATALHNDALWVAIESSVRRPYLGLRCVEP